MIVYCASEIHNIVGSSENMLTLGQFVEIKSNQVTVGGNTEKNVGILLSSLFRFFSPLSEYEFSWFEVIENE